MPLAAGQTLTYYEILGPLGAGGMGEVYRARDTRLEREVAIKVLPEDFADDEERLRRFEREAKTLASLNHTNVAGIHGVDQEGDVCFLALELVPGEDLVTRLARGPLPVDEAIDVCRQIAEGLEVAHEAGVVHRDLKPANVRVTPEGVVKILDFGLAKPIHSKATREGTTTAESDSFLMTEEGLVLGTPTYMSPEQARGKRVDRRTDIWAFGCVLFECLTGRRVFVGESLTDVLAAIVEREPDWSQLPAVVPAEVRRLLRRCLQKDPRVRLRDVGEARVALETALAEPAGAQDKEALHARSRRGVYLWGALVGVAALAVGFVLGRGEGQPEETAAGGTNRGEMHVQVHEFAPGESVLEFQISPDGRSLAWRDDDAIWVRRLEDPDPLQVYTGSATQLVWSPDSSELWFVKEEALNRVSASGGASERVSAIGDLPVSLNWLSDGLFLFGDLDRVWSAPPEGKPVEVLVELDEDWETGHWHMLHLLPDGNVLGAFHDAEAAMDKIQVFRDGESEAVLQLREGEFGAIRLAQEGLLVYEVLVEGESSLWSATLSPTGGELLAEPRLYTRGASNPSVSHNGSLAYLALDGIDGTRQMAWLDLEEPELELFDEPQVGLSNAVISPDGRRIAFTLRNTLSSATYLVHDLDREVSTPVVQRKGWGGNPAWLPGDRLATSHATGEVGTFAYSLTGRGDAQHLSEDQLLRVSPDEQYFVLAGHRNGLAAGQTRIVGPGLDGDTLPHVSPEDEFKAFSSDGEWMLYASDRSGTDQLYLSSFPPGDQDWSVCVGRVLDAWFQKGEEAIYYVTASRRWGPQTVWRVELALDPALDSEVSLGVPEALRELDETMRIADYDGHDRFLVLVETDSVKRRAILHTGWAREAARR